MKHLQQSHLELSKVSPIEKNRLIAFVNHFVISVIGHLNDVTNLVDSKLNALNNKLNICHANLVILETKLNSIASLGTVKEPSEAKQSEVKQEPTNLQSPRNDEVTEKGESEENNVNDKVSQEDTNGYSADEEPEEPREDPMLAKYYKMLQIGVPFGAVQQKMVTEGLDPNLLKAK